MGEAHVTQHPTPPGADAQQDRLTRWRLVLGGDEADGVRDATGAPIALDAPDARRDAVLEELYGPARPGGLGASRPGVTRWLGDIRAYFPSPVVRVMQGDAMARLGLRELLLEPETLGAVQPDIGLVSTLIELGGVIPERSREQARAVVRAVTDELARRLTHTTVQAITGALDRASRTTRPRMRDIDWNRTIAANLKNYLPEQRTVVPERLIGRTRRQTRVKREVILCVDQSGSMGESVVYSAVFGAVLASLPSVATRIVAFDTNVVDLTPHVADPVDVLFGVQLGGGTDIQRALQYAQALVTDPSGAIMVLVSDLYDGGLPEHLQERVRSIVASGVRLIALLALSDQGRPSFHEHNAKALADLGVPAFACTPDLFPDLMAAAIEGRDLGEWAAAHDIATTHETGEAPR